MQVTKLTEEEKNAWKDEKIKRQEKRVRKRKTDKEIQLERKKDRKESWQQSEGRIPS
jgi:hypothetical protein